uniref:Trafficking protein particle complex subunit 6B n=1 Tax=Rhabditophanes sp. KR3021 TaxID=114890 RepID=A0AC35TT39_9BILA
MSSVSTSLLAYNLLQMEIVKYQKDAAEQADKKRKQMFSRKEEDMEACAILKEEDSVIVQLFTHGSAETRLEAMGFRIGKTLCEKNSKEVARLSSSLEIMKFVCKDFWSYAFAKQADNLKTNNQGIFVIFDNSFSFLVNFSKGKQFVESCGIHLALPSGIIRGALAALNVKAVVTASIETLPAAKFQIHLQSN